MYLLMFECKYHTCLYRCSCFDEHCSFHIWVWDWRVLLCDPLCLQVSHVIDYLDNWINFCVTLFYGFNISILSRGFSITQKWKESHCMWYHVSRQFTIIVMPLTEYLLLEVSNMTKNYHHYVDTYVSQNLGSLTNWQQYINVALK